MAKISFTKVEYSLDDVLRKMTIDHLKELGTIANLLNESKPKISNKTIEDMLTRFRKELKKLKKSDPKLYQQLDIGNEDEQRFLLPFEELTFEDWMKLKAIREKIDILKRELRGQQLSKEEDEKRIESERVKHINKRFNIREGWLPLK